MAVNRRQQLKFDLQTQEQMSKLYEGQQSSVNLGDGVWYVRLKYKPLIMTRFYKEVFHANNN